MALFVWRGIAVDQLQFGDFNGDGYTDVFSTVPLSNGDYQWQYSSAGNSNYANLAYDDTPPDQLRFADFNGDGVTDVFKLVQRCDIYLPTVIK